MDWIERLFHVAPDGGSGSLEAGIVAGAAVALVLLIASAITLSTAVKHWLAPLASPPRESEPTRRPGLAADAKSNGCAEGLLRSQQRQKRPPQQVALAKRTLATVWPQ